MAWDLISQQRERFLQELNKEGFCAENSGFGNTENLLLEKKCATRNRYTLMHWASLTARKKKFPPVSQSEQESLKGLLTVLIPTLPEREKIRTPLLEELDRQGVPFLLSDRVGLSTGKKRNLLLDLVSTPYFAFIDDDDWIASNYGDALLSYLNRFTPHIDVLAFSVLYLQNQLPPKTILLGNQHHNWHLNGPVLRRPVLPWCVMKTDFAQPISFPDLYWGEDRLWSEQVSRLQPSVINIPHHLYCYEFLEDDSKTHQEKHIQAFYGYLSNRS
jgi:hypothetical protein